MSLAVYKTTAPRFLAGLIDGLVFIFPLYLSSFFETSETPAIIAIFGLIIYYTLSHCYGIIFHTYFGQTIGKMIMKVRVFDNEGDPITFRHAFFREFPYILITLGFLISDIFQIITIGIDENFRNSYLFWTAFWVLSLWTLAEIIVVFSNEKRRALHDYIAGTVVIKTNL